MALDLTPCAVNLVVRASKSPGVSCWLKSSSDESMKEWKLVSHTFALGSTLLSIVLQQSNISLCRLDMPCSLDDRLESLC